MDRAAFHNPIIAAALALYIGTATSFGDGSGARWRWSNPTPHGNNILDIAYSPSRGLGVQVGDRGQIYTSEDLLLWIPRESGTLAALRSVAFHAGRILVAGEGGLILESDDGIIFRPAVLDVPTDHWFEGVASGPVAVAAGDNGAVYTSSSGANWSRQTSGLTDWLRSVAYGSGTAGNLFVAVGENGTVATSPDGTDWTRRTSGTTQHLNRVAFVNGRFAAVGDNGVAITSAGGLIWQPEITGAGGHLYAIAGYGVGTRLYAGEAEVRILENGFWTSPLAQGGTNAPPDWTYYSAVGQTGFFLLGGRTGMIVEGYKRPSSGFDWITASDSPRHWLWDVARVGDLYAAAGDRAVILTSGDGARWDIEVVPQSVTNSIFLGIGGNSNLLVAAGDNGAIIFSPNTTTNVVTGHPEGGTVTNEVNTFGVVWHPVEPRPVSHALQGVAASESLYVVAGDAGTILTSANGSNWTARATPGAPNLSGVAAFPGGFVAVGSQGTILSSSDGTGWTLRTSGTTNWISRVRHLNGHLLAAGQNGTILTSSDGMHWTPRSSGTSRWLNDATFLDGKYYVVGNQGTVLVSADSANWTSMGTATGKSLYGAAADGSQIVTVGIEGIILRRQVVPHQTPVNILEFSRRLTAGDTTVQHLYLFGGRPDQIFTLDLASGVDGGFVAGHELEILDVSGTLLLLESGPAAKAPPAEFYRTRLIR